MCGYNIREKIQYKSQITSYSINICTTLHVYIPIFLLKSRIKTLKRCIQGGLIQKMMFIT